MYLLASVTCNGSKFFLTIYVLHSIKISLKSILTHIHTRTHTHILCLIIKKNIYRGFCVCTLCVLHTCKISYFSGQVFLNRSKYLLFLTFIPLRFQVKIFALRIIMTRERSKFYAKTTRRREEKMITMQKKILLCDNVFKSAVAFHKISNKSLSNPHSIGTYSFLLLSIGLYSFAMSSFDERRQAK